MRAADAPHDPASREQSETLAHYPKTLTHRHSENARPPPLPKTLTRLKTLAHHPKTPTRLKTLARFKTLAQVVTAGTDSHAQARPPARAPSRPAPSRRARVQGPLHSPCVAVTSPSNATRIRRGGANASRACMTVALSTNNKSPRSHWKRVATESAYRPWRAAPCGVCASRPLPSACKSALGRRLRHGYGVLLQRALGRSKNCRPRKTETGVPTTRSESSARHFHTRTDASASRTRSTSARPSSLHHAERLPPRLAQRRTRVRAGRVDARVAHALEPHARRLRVCGLEVSCHGL